jgi:hypothetical protein
MCNWEVNQLREMFPDCPENILDEASERYASLDSAVDFIMGNSTEAIRHCLHLFCMKFSNVYMSSRFEMPMTNFCTLILHLGWLNYMMDPSI